MPVSRPGGLKRGPLFDTNIPATEIDKDIFTDQEVEASIAGDDLILMLDVSEDPDVIKYMTRSNFVAGLTGDTVKVSDNESTAENNLVTFVADAASTTGQQAIEMDGDFHYNPSSGTVTATTFSGALSGNATTATALATGRTISMTGDVAWTSGSFDGSGTVTGAGTIQANAVHSSMLNTDVISAQSEITSGLAAADELLYSDAGVLKKVGLDTLVSKLAGTGLSASSGVLSVDSAYEGDVQAVTAGVGLSGGGTSGTVNLALDLSELTDTAIANGDYIVFTDTTDSNATVKGDLADVATLFAGTGLTASSSVIGVDASQTQITGVGTITTGTWEATDVGVAHGGTGASSLTANAILTGNGTSAIQAETDLLFSSNKLIPTATAHDAAGTALTVSAGATTAGTTNNIAGGSLTFQGGQGKGSGAGGDIIFQTANAGGSGSSINSLATAVTISDDLSVTLAGTLELGHASDTTIARSGSGDITIEGNAVYRAGGTDVAVTDGGTGASTATAGFDALSPMTAEGDILYGGSSGTVTKLAKGSDADVLTLASGVPSWATPTTGDITGVTAGNGLSGGGSSGGVSLALDLSELSDTAIANGDYIVFTDTTDSNASVKGDLADVATLFAGTGLTASSSVIGVDASQTQITAVGTIATGVWEATDVAVAHGGTGASTLTANGVLIGNGTSAVTAVDMSTKGGLLAGDGSGNPSVLAVGASNGHVLMVDSGEATGLKYAAVPAGTADALEATSASANQPLLTVTNTHADATAGILKFIKDPGSGQGADNDVMGTLTFYGTDASNNAPEELARMEAYIIEADHGSEAGGIKFSVAENDATMTAGLQILGVKDADGEIDVTIGAGAASTTTIAGTLTMGSTAAMTNAGLLSVANQSNITGVGTISSGTWEATDVAVAHGGTGASTATAGFDALSPMSAEGDIIYGGTSGTVTRLGKGSDTQVLTLASGVPTWASPTTGDITGVDLTGGTNINISSETNTTGGAYSSTINLDASPVLTSSSANEPILTLTNTHADATSGIIKFIKDPGSGQGADSDTIGTLTFFGTDAGNNAPEELARMEAYVIEADHGSEAGGIKFSVAENDATMTAGLQILGVKDADGEIDVTIGAGAASTTIIAGTLTMGSTASMTNAGLLSVANQSNITGLGTISSGTWEATDVAVAHGGTGASSAGDARTNLGLGTAAVAATGISNTNVPVFTTGVADDDFLRVAGTSIEGRSASEVLSDIGGQASLTFGISNTNAVKIDAADVADDEYARFTANGLESRTAAEVAADIEGSIDAVGTIASGTWEATDIAVAHGGTGASTLTANGVLIGNGTSAVTAVDMSTKGGILAGDGSGNPSVLAVGGTDGHVLTVDSSEATGLKYAAASGGASTGFAIAMSMVF